MGMRKLDKLEMIEKFAMLQKGMGIKSEKSIQISYGPNSIETG